jgi:hypothetical protein
MLSNNMRSVITEVIDEENEKLVKSNLSSQIEASIAEQPLAPKGGIQSIDPNYSLKSEDAAQAQEPFAELKKARPEEADQDAQM